MLLFTSLALGLVASASPITRRAVDNTLAVGVNPIGNFSVDHLGVQTSNNSCSHRDLGFTGSIAGTWYAVYGDTLWCQDGVSDPSKDSVGFFGLVRDSVSLTTESATTVHDLNLNNASPVAHPQQFVPFNSSWGEDSSYGFGGTSLVEVDHATAKGAIFYLVNANVGGLKGAGVAKVEVINAVPTVTERLDATGHGYFWDVTTHPRYGDVAAFRDPNSNYIYAWGGAPTIVAGIADPDYVYQIRVNAADAYSLSKYEYWHGWADGWKQGQAPATFNAENAVFYKTGQGQVVWSTYYSCYIFVHLNGNDVALRTAPKPEGPWTPDVVVHNVQIFPEGYAYAGVAHPYLDLSGRTLTVSFTNYPNMIEVIQITFGEKNLNIALALPTTPP